MTKPNKEQWEQLKTAFLENTDVEMRIKSCRDEFEIWLGSPLESNFIVTSDGKWRIE